MSKIIVIGNEKGGSGKTTTTMHLAITLAKLGFKVGTIDIDSRQQSLTRYIQNRAATLAARGDSSLAMPEHVCISKSQKPSAEEAEKEEKFAFAQALEKLTPCDFILIDTPGSDSILSREAHKTANMVITPINDSFMDLDLIGVIEGQNCEKAKPGIYSAIVWEQKMKRAAQQAKELEWVVVRNRLSSFDAINKRKMEEALQKLSKRFGFRIASGFSDRVIFKELFLAGLTLHDAASSKEIRMSASVIAARQELIKFAISLGLPEIDDALRQQSSTAAA